MTQEEYHAVYGYEGNLVALTNNNSMLQDVKETEEAFGRKFGIVKLSPEKFIQLVEENHINTLDSVELAVQNP